MNAKLTNSIAAALMAAVALSPLAAAHNTAMKSPSPRAWTAQEIGMQKVTIEYCRPAVKERVVWGELVKYGQLWSPGANEATTFEFASDVMINGQHLAAGKYSFHVIPTEGDWTIIFNKNAALFRSMKYEEAQDALRFTVTPEEAPHQERLLYGFEDLTDDSATAFMQFEKKKIKFTITAHAAHEEKTE